MITAFLHDHEVDIACISETWLIGEDKPVVMEINKLGYQMLHVPHATCGGVGILYKTSLNIQSRHCKLDFNSFEIIETVLLIGSEETLLIACLYQPCNAGLSKSSIDNFFFEFETSSINYKSFMCSPIVWDDFNFHLQNVMLSIPFNSNSYVYHTIFINI